MVNLWYHIIVTTALVVVLVILAVRLNRACANRDDEHNQSLAWLQKLNEARDYYHEIRAKLNTAQMTLATERELARKANLQNTLDKAELESLRKRVSEIDADLVRDLTFRGIQGNVITTLFAVKMTWGLVGHEAFHYELFNGNVGDCNYQLGSNGITSFEWSAPYHYNQSSTETKKARKS